jgi:lipopolysaccharide transport system ATP-binding protein
MTADPSNEILVKVEGVSKKFCRDLKKSLWYGMKDVASELLPIQNSKFKIQNSEVSSSSSNSTSKIQNSKFSPPKILRAGEFWAVSDVSFELRRGECLGLIGRNGAGKTTLLKMLNGLIKPDTGSIEMRGRVGALIALGAGFNPILTGRENIYVNGSILGLSKEEIDDKMNDIIDFAEIPDFIDSPVQSYSSGMQVRLGFAVATALDPDVLILDEVLAVGDAAFRAKCYKRISLIRENSAILFVSHSMDQVSQITNRILYMKNGISNYFSSSKDGINCYNGEIRNKTTLASKSISFSSGVDVSLKVNNEIIYGDSLLLEIIIKIPNEIESADIRLVLKDQGGTPCFDSYTRTQNSTFCLKSNLSKIRINTGPIFLKQDMYYLSIAILNQNNNEHVYWGDSVENIFVHDGPATAACHYTPKLTISINDQ